jgi:hypothetical protein
MKDVPEILNSIVDRVLAYKPKKKKKKKRLAKSKRADRSKKNQTE